MGSEEDRFSRLSQSRHSRFGIRPVSVSRNSFPRIAQTFLINPLTYSCLLIPLKGVVPGSEIAIPVVESTREILGSHRGAT
jgi:hypothetical protein